jgi:hypothetical protein
MERPSPEDSIIKAASLRSTKLLLRTFHSQAIVGSSLGVLDVLGSLKNKVLQDHLSGGSGVLNLLLQSKLIIGFDANRDFSKIADALADQAKINAEKVVAAAAIILSHSLADDIFTESCKMAIELDPDLWRPDLKLERTFPLKIIMEEGIDNLLTQELTRFGNSVGNKSLPNRAQLLFSHVPIDHHSLVHPTDEEYFKMDKLVELDDLRHDLVHRDGLPKILPEKGAQAMAFFHEAAQTALRSVANAYGVPLDFEYMKSLFPPKLLA